jgi:hypothetical protein
MDHHHLLVLLEHGELTIQGQFLQGSNFTFLGKSTLGDETIDIVYKPTRGERPLWDFPQRTLAKREVAAYMLSQELGWELVPPTVYRRKKLPIGPGSVQVYIEHNPLYHYFSLEKDDRARLKPAALFDLLTNNADRKGSHILVDESGHIWLIDHGLCFHREPKLRTVIWDFIGQPIPDELKKDMIRILPQLARESDFAGRLHACLSWSEINALSSRCALLLSTGVFPEADGSRRAYPYPPL